MSVWKRLGIPRPVRVKLGRDYTQAIKDGAHDTLDEIVKDSEQESIRTAQAFHDNLVHLKEQFAAEGLFEKLSLGSHLRDLKEFLQLHPKAEDIEEKEPSAPRAIVVREQIITQNDLMKLLYAVHATFDKQDVKEKFISKSLDKEIGKIKEDINKLNKTILAIHDYPDITSYQKSNVNIVLGGLKEILEHKSEMGWTWHQLLILISKVMIDAGVIISVVRKEDNKSKNDIIKSLINTTTTVIKECEELSLEEPARGALAKLKQKLDELIHPKPAATELPLGSSTMRAEVTPGTNHFVSGGYTHTDRVGTRTEVDIIETEVPRESSPATTHSPEIKQVIDYEKECSKDKTFNVIKTGERISSLKELMQHIDINPGEYQSELEHYIRWIKESLGYTQIADILIRKADANELNTFENFASTIHEFNTRE